MASKRLRTQLGLRVANVLQPLRSMAQEAPTARLHLDPRRGTCLPLGAYGGAYGAADAGRPIGAEAMVKMMRQVAALAALAPRSGGREDQVPDRVVVVCPRPDALLAWLIFLRHEHRLFDEVKKLKGEDWLQLALPGPFRRPTKKPRQWYSVSLLEVHRRLKALAETQLGHWQAPLDTMLMVPALAGGCGALGRGLWAMVAKRPAPTVAHQGKVVWEWGEAKVEQVCAWYYRAWQRAVHDPDRDATTSSPSASGTPTAAAGLPLFDIAKRCWVRRLPLPRQADWPLVVGRATFLLKVYWPEAWKTEAVTWLRPETAARVAHAELGYVYQAMVVTDAEQQARHLLEGSGPDYAGQRLASLPGQEGLVRLDFALLTRALF
jgi:hypothetical protein